MDIFGDDIDSILAGDGEDLNENIRDVDIDGDGGNNEDEDGEKKDADGIPIPVEPKKRSIRNPQLRLNVERLKCDRGVHTVENSFKDIRFAGKGHERQDLNNIMKRLEHWAHRLYPNYNFDDFLSTTEKLGKKKQIQTHMYRYRQGLLEENKAAVQQTEDDEDGAVGMEGIEPIDELDEIIDQQIQNYTMAPPKTPGHDTTFDSLRSSVIATPKFMGRRPVEASTPMTDAADLGVRPLNDTPSKDSAPPAAKLNSDQMARIAENRRLAQERLRAKRDAQLRLEQEREPQQQLEQIEEDNSEFII